MQLLDSPKGNYRFLTGIAPYSSGVIANPDYEIVRATLHEPLPYRQGFDLIGKHLAAQGQSSYALCAVELRSPEPFTFEGFAAFNQGYRALLAEWDLLVGEHNPVARTNVAPEVRPPAEPLLYAFSYTVPAASQEARPTFVVAGAGDLVEGTLSPEAIIRSGETSSDALREKAAYVVRTMASRLEGLGVGWSEVTAVDIYTVHPLHPFLAGTVLEGMGQAAAHGAHWFLARPPITGLEFEMDARGIRCELRLG
jgi:hypothetical protein